MVFFQKEVRGPGNFAFKDFVELENIVSKLWRLHSAERSAKATIKLVGKAQKDLSLAQPSVSSLQNFRNQNQTIKNKMEVNFFYFWLECIHLAESEREG